MAVPKPLLTEFGNDHRIKSCVFVFPKIDSSVLGEGHQGPKSTLQGPSKVS